MSSTLTCPRCASVIAPGTKFCAECGNDVTSVSGGGVAGGATERMTTVDIEAAMLEFLKQGTAGEFEINRELGRGGMAMVFLAKDISLNRDVAIKVMSPQLGVDQSMAERFVREAQTAASLSHPNIIPVYAVRQTANLTFFVMKYVQGRPLDDIMKEVGAMPLALACAILSQTASALGYGHKRGVVHRDVKPGNVMIDDEGWAVVTDFGIAKVDHAEGLTQTGAAIGTPTYMSPEQCTAKKVTGASDQYSLGIMAYEMITGQKPFDGESVMSIMYAHVNEPPPLITDVRPDCPPELAATVARMLAKKPEERFATMDEVASAFGSHSSAGSDDAVRTEMITLAASGMSSKLIDNVRTPRSPAPMQSLQGGKAVTPASGVRPSAPTLRTPTASDAVDSGALVDSGQVPATSKSRLGLISVAVIVVGAGIGVVALKPWEGSAAPDPVPQEPTTQDTQPSPPPTPVVASLELDPPSASLTEGDDMMVGLRVFDSSGANVEVPVTWTSSDSTVAFVSNGAVIARQPGTAQITVRAGDQQAGFALTVNRRQADNPPSPRVTTINVSPSSAQLEVGQSRQFASQAFDQNRRPSDRTLAWSSSDASVASVSSSGLVTAISPGSATITVQRDNARETVRVTVTEVAVARISVSAPATRLQVGGSTQASANLTSSSGSTIANRTVSWSSSDPNVASVDATGRVSAVGAGDATITAAAGGQSGSIDVTVSEPRPAGPTLPPEAESRQQISSIVERFRVALESRDMNRVLQVFPDMPSQQQQAWRTGLFEVARSLTVRYQPPAISLNGDRATVTTSAQLEFQAAQNQRLPQTHEFDLIYRNGNWVITEWRASN